MRGTEERSGSLFNYVDLEARVPEGHPLRAIRALTNATLAEMSGDFEALYARTERPGIAPEKLLRALLLQALYSIRSERQLMEQLEFNLLFRWFVGLGVDERVWDATVFTKNRERLLAGEVASRFLARLVGLAPTGGATYGGSLEAEADYGFSILGGGFTGTPYLGVGAWEGSNDWRLGWRLAPVGHDVLAFRLGIEGTRREHAGRDVSPEHGIALRFVFCR